jgi:hypothetical protein
LRGRDRGELRCAQFAQPCVHLACFVVERAGRIARGGRLAIEHGQLVPGAAQRNHHEEKQRSPDRPVLHGRVL